MAQIKCGDKEFHLENIYCVGRNYVEHIQELNHQPDDEIMIFTKPNSAIHFEGRPVQLPDFSSNIHYECEIVILIGKDSLDVSINHPMDYVAGYAIGIDLTARDIQQIEIQKGLPWLKSKGFKQAALISSFITPDKIPNPDFIHFELSVNHKIVQIGNSNQMIHSIPEIVESIHHLYGLKKGDIIYTGTPKGVGEIHAKDELFLNLENHLVTAKFIVA